MSFNRYDEAFYHYKLLQETGGKTKRSYEKEITKLTKDLNRVELAKNLVMKQPESLAILEKHVDAIRAQINYCEKMLERIRHQKNFRYNR